MIELFLGGFILHYNDSVSRSTVYKELELAKHYSALSVSGDRMKEEELIGSLAIDAEFENEYNRAAVRYDIMSQLFDLRMNLDITKDELANLSGVPKVYISRLEEGTYNPSIDLLAKVAQSLGKMIKVSIV